MNQNNLERIFRQGPDGKHRFTKTHDTSNRFSSLCKDVLAGEKDFSQTAFHTGFGIPKDGNIPLRLPAILIPTLESMRGLLQAGIIPPQFSIYQATSVISSINSIDSDIATFIAQAMESRLYDFVKNNFPELLEYITFTFGKKDSDIEVLESICKHVDSTLQTLDSEEHAYFQTCGEKHSNGRANSLYYTTANTFYNGGYPESPFPEMGDITEIIPVGGRSETKFFEALLKTQTSTREILPLITQVGAFPTYYRASTGDIQTDIEISEHSSGNLILHPDIEKDITILSQYNTI